MDTTDTKTIPRIGNYAPYTNKLIERLRGGKPGDTLTDDELETVAGFSCASGQRCYSNLMTAIKYCEGEGIIWRRQRGEKSIACQRATEVVEQAVADTRGIHRRAKRTTKRLIMTDTSDLSSGEKMRHASLLAQAGTLAMVAHGATRNRIESSTPAPKALPLDAFLRTVAECSGQNQ